MEPQDDITQFSDKTYHIFRINEILTKCNDFSSTGEFLKWRSQLRLFVTELDQELQKSMNRETLLHIEFLDKKMDKCNQRNILRHYLSTKEKLLRRLYQSMGENNER